MLSDTRTGRPAAQPQKISVLCVDDEPALLELTAIFLGRDGDIVIEPALSASSALEKIRGHPCDVIVSDYLMPGMDGIEFLKELRAGGCTIPFIIFTGKGREDVAIEALNSGADFYLQKGGDPRSQFAELANMIRQAARKRRAEEALRENEEQLHAIIQGSPIPQFVIGRDHRVVHWNRALERQTGIPAAEMVGTNLQWRAFYDRERPCLADLLMDGRTVELPGPYEGEVAPSRYVEGAFEVKEFFPDLGPQGKWLSLTAVPIRDGSGEITGALETLEDITEQTTAGEDLRERACEVEEAHAELEAVFQAFPMVYIRFDHDGSILDLRAKDPFPPFHAYDQLLTRRVRNLLSPEAGALVEGAIRDVLEDRGIQIIDFALDSQGIRHSFEGRLVPLLGQQVLGIFRDITGDKADRTALRLANAKLELLTEISCHEISNSLTSLVAYQELAREASADPLMLEYLEKQHTITSRVRALIEFARVYRMVGAAAPAWQDIHAMITRIPQQLETGEIPVTSDLEGVDVFADPLLEQALLHLAGYILRHVKGVTRIRFGCEESHSGLNVSCESDGTGGSPEDREPLFTGGEVQDTWFPLVKEILNVTGISIKETDPGGRGARFEISVPQGNYRISAGPEPRGQEGSRRAMDLPALPTER